MKETCLTSFICLVSMHTSLAEPLYTLQGVDPPFAALKNGKLKSGSNSKHGVTGSTINVKNTLVELTQDSRRPISKEIRIHTLGNGAVPRDDFGKWSRWYQENGHTQVFRLFKGETNLHNARENAARIEAFSNVRWKRGAWHEWSGTYTLIKLHGAMIFQLKNDKNDWAVSLGASGSGSVKLNHRRGNDVIIAKDMIGKPFHIRVRDDGHDYEVYLDGKKRDGHVIAPADIPAQVDQVAHDTGMHRICCARKTGKIAVVGVDKEMLAKLGEVPSSPGARSIAIDSRTHRVWTAYNRGASNFVQPFTVTK